MQNIDQEYIVLFNAITDAERSLMSTIEKLRFAQQAAEELYISKDLPPLSEDTEVSA